MERVTFSMSDEFAGDLEEFMTSHHYANRSEAVRDLARLGLEQRSIGSEMKGQCVATLSYVYNHHTRELAKRLTETHHDHHDLQIATMHVHLDHDNCLEVVVLRGKASIVREYSEKVIAERGITNGHVSYVPVTLGHRHTHVTDHDYGQLHFHTHPKS